MREREVNERTHPMELSSLRSALMWLLVFGHFSVLFVPMDQTMGAAPFGELSEPKIAERKQSAGYSASNSQE
jgi:hypothetical protein